MATIDKRTSPRTGKVTWRVRIRRTNLPDITKSFSNKSEAKQWAFSTEAALIEGRLNTGAAFKKHRVNDVFDLYEDDIVRLLKDPYNRITHLKFWRIEIGSILLHELSSYEIRTARQKLRAKQLDSTTNRYLASLSAALSFAVNELDWIDKNPALKVKKFREPRGRTRFLSDSEREKLLQASTSLPKYPEMQIIILIALTTGMRRGEILNLRWSDCDFKLRRLIIRDSKNSESRSVPLADVTLTSLRKWGKVRPLDANALVFPSHVSANPSHLFEIDHAWQLIRAKADLKDFRFHDLRHTAASYLAMSGAGLREIGDILGHKSISMTKRYSHLTEDHKYCTVSKMVHAVFGESLS
jgi:integrase